MALPESRDHNGTTLTSIMTATDKFTKRKHLIPTRTIATIDAAYAMLHIIKLHGLPQAQQTVTDRGTQSDSEFFRELSKLLSIQQSMSSAWHPQCLSLLCRPWARYAQPFTRPAGTITFAKRSCARACQASERRRESVCLWN
ncbi:hypothetical protein D6C78_06620 [Aureobasidium pullulans]|uniref:Integrase catalytic domain-containing protein n=1 Tax=Aureobasidium pullulans TaxID=5580 RepID=A0A4T0BQF6_AURPU|nr:hypothetical protein D6C78_06620 [Aureobasidium pullulans]